MRRVLLAVTMAACTGLLGCETEDLLEPVGAAGSMVPAKYDLSEIKVMSRNVYLGFDIDQVLAGTMSLEEGLGALAATDFVTRAYELAGEIGTEQPDLIGLQEVITYNIGPQTLDFLEALMYMLQLRGLNYEVVANNTTTDIEVPFGPGIRYRDHDVILARVADAVELGPVTNVIYDARLSFNLFDVLPGTRPLGFVAVEAVVNGTRLIFASTHLETQNYPDIQTAQTKQLISWTQKQQLPMILVGDLNSAANPNAPADKYTRSYDMLLTTGGFTDLWMISHPHEDGLTCCYEPNLMSATPPFDQRLDLILMDKVAARLVKDVDVTITGINPFQDTQPRWASDHAGVVGTLWLPVEK